jgi:starch-binding outer membrane protein, SusD/RagB family
MKQLLKITILAVAVPILFSCSKDFLDAKQTGVMSEDTYFSNMENILMAVNGVYGEINIQPAGIHNIDIMMITFGSIASDDAEAGGEQGGNDFLDIQDADKGTIQPVEPKIQSQEFYAYSYKTINRANSVLAGINKFLGANSVSTADAALLQQYKGEMKFMVGLMHFRLVQVYGGVPLIDHILGSTEYESVIVRNPIGDCMRFIETQFKEASALLPWSYSATEVGRATKGAALAFLAKAYLYEASYGENYAGDVRFGTCNNTYALAAQYADSVINSSQYKLIGIDGQKFDSYWNRYGSPIYPDSTPGYRYIFCVEGENSAESIFEVQNFNDNQPYMATRGSYLTVYMACRNTSAGGLGWGFNCPTEDLFAAYDSLDPRMKVSIGRNGDPILTATGALSTGLVYSWATLAPFQSPTNMISRKFECAPAEYWKNKTADGNGPNDFYYMRYGDLVLIAAEAMLKGGIASLTLSGKTPVQIVNDLHKRARNGATTGVPADVTSIDFEGLVKERRLELAMEGHRFFDLVRWKKQDVLVGATLQKYLGGTLNPNPVISSFTAGKNDFFPIPQVDILNSNGTMSQYAGW